MDRKLSSGGFVEVIVVLMGLAGLATLGILHAVPNIVSSPVAVQTSFEPSVPTAIPTETPQPSPTAIPDTMALFEAIGMNLTEDLKVEAIVAGEQKIFPLLGVEKPATAAACLSEYDTDYLTRKIVGKTVYLIDYNTEDTTDSRYVFLNDLTFLNKYLISNGLAIATAENQMYQAEFLEEQQKAKTEGLGMWSARCLPTPTKISSPSPTTSPTPSPTRTLTPTKTPAPTKTPSKTPTPTVKIQSAVRGERTQTLPSPTPTVSLSKYLTTEASGSAQPVQKSNSADLILQLINSHRKKINRIPFETDPQLCALAQSRAPELYNEIFVTGQIHAGFFKRNLPYWITENVASYAGEETIVNWWLGSTVHRNAIEGNYTYSCGACSGNSCAQLFTSYAPK